MSLSWAIKSKSGVDCPNSHFEIVCRVPLPFQRVPLVKALVAFLILYFLSDGHIIVSSCLAV